VDRAEKLVKEKGKSFTATHRDSFKDALRDFNLYSTSDQQGYGKISRKRVSPYKGTGLIYNVDI